MHGVKSAEIVIVMLSEILCYTYRDGNRYLNAEVEDARVLRALWSIIHVSISMQGVCEDNI